MHGCKTIACLGLAACAVSVGGRLEPSFAAARTSGAALAGSPLGSRQLWATVDVCGPHDQPNTIGIRGSMPGDGSPRDTMYMRFRVQYLDPASKVWIYVAHGADSGFLKVGSADVARQAGRSIQFSRSSGRPAYTLRGVVSFQWRRGSATVLSATRVTSAGHRSSAGADPKGYSAATCTLS